MQIKYFTFPGLHDFTGGDWGGKFVGHTKVSWVKYFLGLDSDDEIIKALTNLGSMELEDSTDVTEGLPTVLKPLEAFTCKVCLLTMLCNVFRIEFTVCNLSITSFCYLIQVYGDNSMIPNIADLRWKLFCTKNLEGESLPPTRHALFQYCLRANGLSQRDKSYTEKFPQLPDYTKCGFKIVGGKYKPIMNMQLPAPKAVLEFVSCGCKTKRCSCVNAGLYCTPLCRCYYDDCDNKERMVIDDEDVPEPNEDDEL